MTISPSKHTPYRIYPSQNRACGFPTSVSLQNRFFNSYPILHIHLHKFSVLPKDISLASRQSLPAKAFPLSPTVQPFKQALYHLSTKFADTLKVIWSSTVIIISNKHLVQFLYYGFYGKNSYLLCWDIVHRQCYVHNDNIPFIQYIIFSLSSNIKTIILSHFSRRSHFTK